MLPPAVALSASPGRQGHRKLFLGKKITDLLLLFALKIAQNWDRKERQAFFVCFVLFSTEKAFSWLYKHFFLFFFCR